MTKIASLLTVLLLVAFSLPASAKSHKDKGGNVNIHLLDYCDPATFNPILGDGACVRDTSSGFITFNGFIAELTAEASAGAWRFNPNPVQANEKSQLVITNVGGELHTFTKVKNFGGGFVDVLNQLSHNPNVAPECGTVVNGQIIPQPPGPDNLYIPAGGNASHAGSEETVNYQCCIHPWMRTTVNAHH